jgi:hypothetical protein
MLKQQWYHRTNCALKAIILAEHVIANENAAHLYSTHQSVVEYRIRVHSRNIYLIYGN